jgi:hypothetical protein
MTIVYLKFPHEILIGHDKTKYYPFTMPSEYNVAHLKQYIIDNLDMKMDINELEILIDSSLISAPGLIYRAAINDDKILNDVAHFSVYRYKNIKGLTCEPWPSLLGG